MGTSTQEQVSMYWKDGTKPSCQSGLEELGKQTGSQDKVYDPDTVEKQRQEG